MEALPRHASAFALELGPEKRLRCAAAFVFCAAATALLALLASHSAVADVPWCSMPCWMGAALVALPAAAWLGWGLSGHEPLSLRWDGQGWYLAERPVRLRIALDFGDWLMLNIRPVQGGSPGRYLALSRANQSQHWHALRATLCATANHRSGQEGAAPWT